MKEPKRSLYCCFNAKVHGETISCSRGHFLTKASVTGSISTKRLRRGEPLELGICQTCGGYDEMGPPIPAEERGWIEIEKQSRKEKEVKNG